MVKKGRSNLVLKQTCPNQVLGLEAGLEYRLGLGLGF